MKVIDLLEAKKGYTGFLLDPKSRKRLFTIFNPKFPEVIAHHITYKMGVGEEAVPQPPKSAEIIGYACDDGIEAYVVAINGSTIRPDGKTYHITWSLDRSKGKKPVHSNNLLQHGFEHIEPLPIKVVPSFFSN